MDVASKADAAQQEKAMKTAITKDYLTQQQGDLIKLMQSPGCDADCQKLAQGAGQRFPGRFRKYGADFIYSWFVF